MVTAVKAKLLRGLDDARATAAFVLHLVAQLGDLVAGALGGDLGLHLLRRRSPQVGVTPGSILPTLTSATPKRPCTGWLTSPDGSWKAASPTAGSRIADFGDQAEIDVGRIEVALAGDVVERGARRDAGARSFGVAEVRKHDLRDLALLRRAEPVLALLEDLLGVLVGDRLPLADGLPA